MSDDYELDDTACPKCGRCPTHSRRCDVVGCEDGFIDLHEFDDPINYSPGETERCEECRGTGIQRWCPNCGWDLQRGEYINGRDESAEKDIEEFPF